MSNANSNPLSGSIREDYPYIPDIPPAASGGDIDQAQLSSVNSQLPIPSFDNNYPLMKEQPSFSSPDSENDYDYAEGTNFPTDWSSNAYDPYSLQGTAPRAIRQNEYDFTNLEEKEVSPTFDANGGLVLYFANDPTGAALYRKRLNMPPQVQPSTDTTIDSIKQNRDEYIKKMLVAMWNQENCKDRQNSIERKLFTFGSKTAVHQRTMEAACFAIFEALVFRCEHGWTGAEKDNLSRKPVPDHLSDRDANCQARMDMIIKALRESKCVCRDVLVEDYKIARFVNAPSAYFDSKSKNMDGNVRRAAQLAERKALKENVEKAKREKQQPEDGAFSTPQTLDKGEDDTEKPAAMPGLGSEKAWTDYLTKDAPHPSTRVTGSLGHSARYPGQYHSAEAHSFQGNPSQLKTARENGYQQYSPHGLYAGQDQPAGFGPSNRDYQPGQNATGLLLVSFTWAWNYNALSWPILLSQPLC